MSHSHGRHVIAATIAVVALTAIALAQGGVAGAKPKVALEAGTMSNPYRLVENWPEYGTIKFGAAIGIVPDGEGGAWIHHRSEPPIIHFNAAGKIVKTFGDGMFISPHGFCRDRDGNFWAADSGPFSTGVAGTKGYQIFKFSPDGKLLLTLGKAGVSKAGPDTFISPTACTIAPNGDIMITDGHRSRHTTAQPDGDRVVRYTKDGKYVGAWFKEGTGPGEFLGPHSLAFDSQGRLFVADRSNNRVQVFDKDMKFIDDLKHFGRPSGVYILKDDTLLVSDSESSYTGFRPIEFKFGPEPSGGPPARNAGWKNGIRIGSAKDGSLRTFIAGTQPEGLAAEESGNIVFGGLTVGCETSPSGGCLQKWVRK
jgi:hypothetical protein